MAGTSAGVSTILGETTCEGGVGGVGGAREGSSARRTTTPVGRRVTCAPGLGGGMVSSHISARVNGDATFGDLGDGDVARCSSRRATYVEPYLGESRLCCAPLCCLGGVLSYPDASRAQCGIHASEVGVRGGWFSCDSCSLSGVVCPAPMTLSSTLYSAKSMVSPHIITVSMSAERGDGTSPRGDMGVGRGKGGIMEVAW